MMQFKSDLNLVFYQVCFCLNNLSLASYSMKKMARKTNNKKKTNSGIKSCEELEQADKNQDSFLQL